MTMPDDDAIGRGLRETVVLAATDNCMAMLNGDPAAPTFWYALAPAIDSLLAWERARAAVEALEYADCAELKELVYLGNESPSKYVRCADDPKVIVPCRSCESLAAHTATLAALRRAYEEG